MITFQNRRPAPLLRITYPMANPVYPANAIAVDGLNAVFQMGLKVTRQTDLQKLKILRSCAIEAGHIRRDDKSIASHKRLRRLLFALQRQ